MIIFKVDIPKGVYPKLEPELLPSNGAQEAENIVIESGAAVPLNGLTQVGTPSKAGTIQTIHLMDGSYWLHWADDVDVVRVPIGDDADEITCFTGDGTPKITELSLATTGGTDYPEDYYELGVPAPGSAPVAVKTGGTSLDTDTAEDVAYVFTFVCEIGDTTAVEMEGPNSDPSNTVTITDPLAISITLANELRADMISHFANATRHTAGQQSTATMPAEATTLATLLTLVATELTLYAFHNADAIQPVPSYHDATAANKALVSVAAPGNLNDAIDRLLDLKAKYNDHEDETVGHAGTASEVNDQVEAFDPTYVTLTLPAFPAGDYNFTAKRIYRTNNAGVAGSTEYKYVDEVAGDTLTYVDTISDDAIDDEIITTTWDPPPSDLHSLKLHPGGFLVGLSGMKLCVSVAYQPHAWPTAWQLQLDYPGVGLEIFGTTILVTTTGKTQFFTGVEPDVLSPEKTEVPQSCVSKRGIAFTGGAVLFPSPDGLIWLGAGVAQNATDKIFSRADWQALQPETITGIYHDGRYYGFYDDGSNQQGFIFDPILQDFLYTSVYATAVHVDPESDTLYLVVSGQIYSWNTNTGSPLTPTWKSKRQETNYPVNPGFARVKASSYSSLTFKLYADISGTMTLMHTETVSSGEAFPLPSGYVSDKFEVVITGGFRSFEVAETIHDLKRI